MIAALYVAAKGCYFGLPDVDPWTVERDARSRSRRATVVRVLTTEAEHAELQRAAEAASMSVSTWVRAVALEKARRG